MGKLNAVNLRTQEDSERWIAAPVEFLKISRADIKNKRIIR